ncbi:hypothetical protein N7478_006015 [Penicillium angulare]|uniref:uncharacterized protein n=1 Tax=Penicillium angulare TaxID=116970 RepID=UPI00253FD1E5|nr:uncharacterized protein N7478_006015 [Penicillium angulare]KAJ5280643.1 hypothetical protein N7478_006015 [Penicillium angulare]
MTSKQVHIGVLLVDTVQLLDLSAIDLLYMTSPAYLTELGLPKPLIDLGKPCKISYISLGGPTARLDLTSQTSIPITHVPTDLEVAPGKLDVIYVPGPSPNRMPPAKEYLDFLRQHNAANVTILSICTGALVIAHAGIATDKIVTAPRFLIPGLKKSFPDVKIWDDSVRVTRDGNLWMCGGITNGHDLVVEYLRENYPAPLVNTILTAAEISPRPLKYAKGPTGDFMWMVWQVLCALPYSAIRFLKGKQSDV